MFTRGRDPVVAAPAGPIVAAAAGGGAALSGRVPRGPSAGFSDLDRRLLHLRMQAHGLLIY
jgi:hypothetical protein